jgi:hypothetical protein
LHCEPHNKRYEVREKAFFSLEIADYSYRKDEILEGNKLRG